MQKIRAFVYFNNNIRCFVSWHMYTFKSICSYFIYTNKCYYTYVKNVQSGLDAGLSRQALILFWRSDCDIAPKPDSWTSSWKPSITLSMKLLHLSTSSLTCVFLTSQKCSLKVLVRECHDIMVSLTSHGYVKDTISLFCGCPVRIQRVYIHK